ncbi:NAD(P)/FAD-dependent oxidoreductase [Paracoccus sp. MKU1]|uniref:FAD/NAD(P)-dependent oxidoreductase n=1 Tax=Paracoccus sp. MKU1 TaxID=1745182 RepID=UPI0007194539|nr:NAD(P)/FAD-dependent oxidoreductase [Paracoccus sp. MKU1]KRW96654.1 hypothetical protein AQY21_07975 [Paracoccus sp. MKU1]
MDSCDILVIGAGPAGMEAALAASAGGARVIVVERAPWPGGNIFRHHGLVRSSGAGRARRPGDALKRRFLASGCDIRLGCSVISAAADRSVVVAGPSGLQRIRARAVILACGASERIIPFPGWTSPGVIGLAALTNMMKADDAVPAGRIVLSGMGPLLYSAAWKAHGLGADIAAIVDPLPLGDWLAALPRMLARPGLLSTGAYWMMRLRLAEIPILRHSHIREIRDQDDRKIVVVSQAGEAERMIPADFVCAGHGLRPNTEVTRLIGAEHEFLAARGGLVPVLTEDSETTVPGYFVAGDSGGIAGAESALRHGAQLGRHVAALLGKPAPVSRVSAIWSACRMRMASSFGRAMAGLAAPREELYDMIGDDTVICRCEEVTRAEYCHELVNPHAAKMRTRCGMGPCQGRYCGDTAAFLLARHRDLPMAQAERWTPRLPIFPTSIDELIGDFQDSDLVSSAASAAERGLL